MTVSNNSLVIMKLANSALAFITHDEPRMMRQELERVLYFCEWRNTERPLYQYMKLREAAESILAGMDVAQPMEDSEKASPDRGDFSPTIALS